MFKVGFGTDLHVLQPGAGLRLGGVMVPCPYQALAHSDGDVLLHAVVDALLGAAGMGDIGEHYPESKVPEGADSAAFVEETLRMITKAGLRLVNVDCVVDVEIVRLKEWKKAIRARLASLLGIPEAAVNVKAKTAEGTGPVGEGRAVSAQAIVLAMAGLPDGELL